MKALWTTLLGNHNTRALTTHCSQAKITILDFCYVVDLLPKLIYYTSVTTINHTCILYYLHPHSFRFILMILYGSFTANYLTLLSIFEGNLGQT